MNSHKGKVRCHCEVFWPKQQRHCSLSSALFLSLVTVTLLFTSCHDVVFYKIKNEVKLEDANITGEIHGIVRFENADGDYLYIDNGQIRYKDATSLDNDDWKKHMDGLSKLKYDYYDSEFSGVQIIKIAADTDNLYALGIEWEVDEDEGENMPKRWVLFTSTGPGTQWTEVWALKRGDWGQLEEEYISRYGVVSLFCTNTYKKANRQAFLRVTLPSEHRPGTTKFYKLDGVSSDFDSEYTAYTYIHAGANAAQNGSTHDAAYLGGSIYFLNDSSNYSGIGTNETTTADATHIYYSDSNTLYYSTTGSSWTETRPGTEGRIISIALTSDYFILGTESGGLFRVKNDTSVPTGRTVDFETNADVALGSPYMIRSIYCMDPEKSETEAVIYATCDFSGSRGTSTGSMDDIGLWSYYPARGNWNRE